MHCLWVLCMGEGGGVQVACAHRLKRCKGAKDGAAAGAKSLHACSKARHCFMLLARAAHITAPLLVLKLLLPTAPLFLMS